MSVTPIDRYPPPQASDPGTFKWWNMQRNKFNIGLLVSGILAYISYVFLLIFGFGERGWMELDIITIFLQGVSFLVLILIANLFYFLGPISEVIFRPRDQSLYRERCFSIGFWFSFLLPFSLPFLVFIKLLFQIIATT